MVHQSKRATKADGSARRLRLSGRQAIRTGAPVLLVIAGFGIGCASTDSPREFMNRLTTPNEGVRAELEQLEERMRQLEQQITESGSESSLLRERIAELESALEEVRAAATAPPPPVPFEPPTPARVQVLEVTELDDAPRDAPPVESDAAAEPRAEPGASAAGDETSASATVAETGQELYDRSRDKYLNRDYVEAEQGFQRFLDDFPDTDLSDNALYWIGECRFARGDDRGAMAAFQTMLHEYPLGNKVPDALVKVGRTLERLGDVEGAKRRFREVTRRFPDSEPARLATESLSRLQQEEG